MEQSRSTSYSAVFKVDPSTLSTAQQKKVSFVHRRIFSNAKVARGLKILTLLAAPHRSAVVSVVPHGTPVRLVLSFFYAWPKGTPKKLLVDDIPMPTGADCDNRAKMPLDALTKAGWWDDDRRVTTLEIRKRRTTRGPRMEVEVSPDDPLPAQ